MDDEKVSALKELMVRHGDKVLDEPLRFENLLKDTMLAPPERSAIVGAMKLGIPQRIREQTAGPLPATVFARLADRLSQEMALKPEAAQAGVELWARALGRDVPAGMPTPTASPIAVPTPPPPGPTPAPNQTPIPPGKPWLWFAKIETKEEAIRIVRQGSIFFFVAGGLQVLVALLLGPLALVDAAVYVVGGWALRQFNSRTAAIGLLVYCIIGVLLILAMGRPPILGVLAIFVSVRATDATLKLNRAPAP
jgi:hypothetical protein